MSFTMYIALLLSFLCMYCGNAEDINESRFQDIALQIDSNEFFVVIFCGDVEEETCQHVRKEVEYSITDSAGEFDDLQAAITTDARAKEHYGVDVLPAVAFFRKTEPMFYSVSDLSEMDGEELGLWLIHNKEIRTITLTDGKFEHDTQAATGATTGDWIVLFYEPTCNALVNTWEFVASSLQGSKIVAKIDLSRNPITKARFNITNCPTIIMFSKGNMYFYDGPHNKVNNILLFAKDKFREEKNIPVPPEPSFFDSLKASVSNTIKVGSPCCSYLMIGGGALLIVLVVVLSLKKRGKRRAKFD